MPAASRRRVFQAEAHAGSWSVAVGTTAGPDPGQPVDAASCSPAGRRADRRAGGARLLVLARSQDTLAHDWQDVGSRQPRGRAPATIMHVCENSQTWQHVTYDLTGYGGMAGTGLVRVHEDGHGIPPITSTTFRWGWWDADAHPAAPHPDPLEETPIYATPCGISFSDVHAGDYFYGPVQLPGLPWRDQRLRRRHFPAL